MFDPSAERCLAILALDRGVPDASGGRAFSLTAQHGIAQILGGFSTRTLGYNGTLPGPALRLRTGEKVTLRVRNDLDEATSVHWHGMLVPAEADGGPHQPIAPGASWSASFTVANPASTCWFHPHLHGATGRQVASGLAGLLIVDDGALSPSMLPDTWGVDDIALVLQDKRFDASGQIDYALAGLAIGLTLAVIHIVGINVTGVSVNPARSLGPALLVGGNAMGQLWLFIVAPLVGAAAAGLLFRTKVLSAED